MRASRRWSVAPAARGLGLHASSVLRIVLSMRVQAVDEPITLDDDLIIAGDNLAVLAALPEARFDLIYMDPPFNTGRAQTRDRSR